MKIKEQESKRMSGKWSDSKLQPESSNATQKPLSTNDQERSKSAIASKKNSCCLNVGFFEITIRWKTLDSNETIFQTYA